MKAITIKYIGPTNFRPSRIKLSAEGMRPLTLPHNDFDINDDSHMVEAVVLFFKHNETMPWSDHFAFGSPPDGTRVAVPCRGSNTWGI